MSCKTLQSSVHINQIKWMKNQEKAPFKLHNTGLMSHHHNYAKPGLKKFMKSFKIYILKTKRLQIIHKTLQTFHKINIYFRIELVENNFRSKGDGNHVQMLD